MKIATVSLAVFLINLPFGYWRSRVPKFSKQWFLSVHLPIPFVVLLRIYSGLGFRLVSYPVFVGAFFLGQLIGGRRRQKA